MHGNKITIGNEQLKLIVDEQQSLQLCCLTSEKQNKDFAGPNYFSSITARYRDRTFTSDKVFLSAIEEHCGEGINIREKLHFQEEGPEIEIGYRYSFDIDSASIV